MQIVLTIKYNYKTKKDICKEVWIPKLGYSKYVIIKVNSKNTDKDQSKRSLFPRIIQSLDGVVIRKTTLLCVIENNFTPPTVHDAVSCHPNNLDDLLKIFGYIQH